MGSYAAENLPLLFCYPVLSLDTDGQLISFEKHGIGTGGRTKKKNNNKTTTKTFKQF